MKINIYKLINPTNNSIIYVGQTTESIAERLKGHYWKLNEVKKGKRNWSKLFHYLNDLLPIKVKIELIKSINIDNNILNEGDFLEQYYIKKYTSEGYQLLNETSGGIGGYTSKYKTKEEKKVIGLKISNKLKNKPKPDGFKEHLSIIRKGINNPMAKPLNPKIVCYKGFELIKIFNYSFEIDDFIGVRGSYSNVVKALTKLPNFRPYGYRWEYYKS